MTLQIENQTISCCNNKSEFEILYDSDKFGKETRNVCSECFKLKPYQQHIILKKSIGVSQ